MEVRIEETSQKMVQFMVVRWFYRLRFKRSLVLGLVLFAVSAPELQAQQKNLKKPPAKTTLKKRGQQKADQKKTGQQKIAAQKALIQTDGAAVYLKPDFDSKLVGYLPAGMQVIASQKLFKGSGGFGLFYKVRAANKMVGYVADTDVIPQLAKGKKGVKENPEFKDIKEKQENPNREPVYFTRFIGGGVGFLGLGEQFEGRTLRSNELLAQFKMVGPGTLGVGLPLDFSFGLGPRVPSYYRQFARGVGGGYFLHSELLLQLPFIESDQQVLGYGLGAMVNYSAFKVTVSDTTIDSQEVRLGAVAGVHYIRRFGRYAVRWDSKYYYERTQYLGHFASFLIEYP